MNHSIVKCDHCGSLGKRAEGCAAPDFWFYLESEDRTEGRPRDAIFVVWACSEACRDGLWKRGPGRGVVDDARKFRIREKVAR